LKVLMLGLTLRWWLLLLGLRVMRHG
jgi:hypothetical protein